MVSLTGAVVSKKVTETHKGKFKIDKNNFLSVMAYTCLTVRQTSRAGTKVGHSDPITLNGWVIA